MIVPTVGRDTLGRALQSCKGADEVLVDYNQDDDFGYAARTRLIARATGTHLVFLDDDDVYAAGAIETFRTHACDRPVVCQMQYRGGGMLWRDRVLRFGNVGTPMILVPNDPERLGEWREHSHGGAGGDYVFLSGCVEKMGAPKWVERVVALIKPD